MRPTITTLFIVILSVSCYAQKHKELSLIGGFGKYSIEDRAKPILPFKSWMRKNYCYGIEYAMVPDNAKFSLSTGVLISSKEYLDSYDSYLRVPCILDFRMGEKFRFDFGFGLYSSLLISEKLMYKTRFQIGSLFRRE